MCVACGHRPMALVWGDQLWQHLQAKRLLGMHSEMVRFSIPVTDAVAVCPADSWWKLFDRFRFMLNALWVVPSGSMLRAYR